MSLRLCYFFLYLRSVVSFWAFGGGDPGPAEYIITGFEILLGTYNIYSVSIKDMTTLKMSANDDLNR